MSHRSAILDLIIEHLFDMEKGVVTAVTALVPSGARDRLVQARLALRLAEERTGLRDAAALEVQRAVSSAPTSPSMSAASAAAGSSQTASLMALTAAQDSGALSLQGSATLLLAALALRQGSADWCAAVGADEVGWCAAVEVGLDLDRVLTVPASALDDASIPTVVSTLLDGVDALLIGSTVAERLRPQHRRRLLARARERGHLILTSAPWEGARIRQAHPLASDTGSEDGASTQAPAEPSTDGVVIPIGRRTSRAPAQAVEIPAGYLRLLTWTLTDPRRPQTATTGALTLSLTAQGFQARPPGAAEPAAGPQEAAG